MTTLEKIRAEIKKRYDDCEEDWENGEQYGYWNCLKIIDKYAEQEPTKEEQKLLQKWRDNRGISIEDFEDAMNVLQEPCDDVVSRQAVLDRREILRDEQG